MGPFTGWIINAFLLNVRMFDLMKNPSTLKKGFRIEFSMDSLCYVFAHSLLIELNSWWILYALFPHIRCWSNWILDGFFMLYFHTFVVNQIEFSMDSLCSVSAHSLLIELNSRWILCALFSHIYYAKCILINPSYILIQALLVDYKFCLASSVVTYSATYISVDISAWHPLRWIFLFRWL